MTEGPLGKFPSLERRREVDVPASQDRLQLLMAKAVHDILFRTRGQNDICARLLEEISSRERPAPCAQLEEPWQSVIRWFELQYGYNPDPSTTPDGEVLRWALKLRQQARQP